MDGIAQSADWTEVIHNGGQSVTFKLDTKAQANLLPADVFVSMKSSSVYNKLEYTNVQLKTHSGHKVHVLGQITLPVRVGECTH